MLHEDMGVEGESGAAPIIDMQNQGSSAVPPEAAAAGSRMQQEAAAAADLRLPPQLAALPKLRAPVATVSAAVGPDFVPPAGSPRHSLVSVLNPGLNPGLSPRFGAQPRTLQDALRAHAPEMRPAAPGQVAGAAAVAAAEAMQE